FTQESLSANRLRGIGSRAWNKAVSARSFVNDNPTASSLDSTSLSAPCAVCSIEIRFSPEVRLSFTTWIVHEVNYIVKSFDA
ncbi:MAG: hypothetical protein AB7F99_16095, partial [Vicinamibacterales bacterium]